MSGNFFDLLGVKPQIGRLFNSDECKWNGPRALLLSHGLWARRFASDPAIVGKTLTINDRPATVVGVLPESFDFATVFAPGSHIDIFVPFPLTQETNRWGNTLAMIGRLKPGVPAAKAQAELRILAPQLTKEHPQFNTFEGKVSLLSEHVSGRARPALIVLACAVAGVMLIVCANLSNLLLARTATRQKEIAIRTALGAGRGRLMQQMLTESIVLASCGALLGLVLAFGGSRALMRLDAISIPLLHNIRIDSTTLTFTLGIAVLTGIVFGLAPALHVRTPGLHDALKDTGRGTTAGRSTNWIRNGLVVSEIAFACVLLVGAGLLIRSFLRVLDVDMGFRPEQAAAMRVDLARRLPTKAENNVYFDEVLRRARDVPGVVGAGLTDALPLGRNRSWGAGVKGHVYKQGEYPNAFVRIISDGYFRAMGIPLRAGRDLTERDTPENQPVIVINETMAHRLFPSEDPLGQVIRACGDRTVVGVVADVRHLALEQSAGNEMYLPIRQCDDYGSVDLVVRSKLDARELAAGVRAALKPINPNLPGNDFRTLQQLVDKAVSPRRFVVLLLGGFALFALILASLGIYAVISYSVNQRTQEIGVRMALGASAGNLQLRIIAQTLGLAIVGMVLGGIASWGLAGTLRGLLFGVTSNDPATFLSMMVVLISVACVAGYLPARRASRIDPMLALRAE